MIIEKLFNRYHKKEPTTVQLSISSKKSIVTGPDKEKLSLITVRIRNKESFFYTNINDHYIIKNYPLHAVELVNKILTSQSLNKLDLNAEMFIEVNGQYFPASILKQFLEERESKGWNMRK